MSLKAIPIDQFFAEYEEARERKYGPASSRDELLAERIAREEARREREKTMAEICREPGCKNPKYKTNAICYEHFLKRQRARRASGMSSLKAKAPESLPVKPVEPTTATNPPVVVTTEEPEKQKEPVYKVGVADIMDLVPQIRMMVTDSEARAYLEGFFDGRRVL